MSKRFCPNVHSDCEDGFIKESDCPCIYWESLDEACTLVVSLKKTYEDLIAIAVRREAIFAKEKNPLKIPPVH